MTVLKNELLQGYTDRIKKYEIENCNNYVYIGMNLAEIQFMNLLEGTEYKNIKHYALDEFGYESTKTYDLINVYNKFFKEDQYGSVSRKYYNKYSFRKLVVMLTMTNEQLLLCKPDMTVKQLKELKFKKSARADSESIENTEKLKNQIPGQNVISGIFSGKIENEFDEKQETIIISSLPQQQEEKKPETKIIVEVKQTEQNDSFVPIESKEEFYKNHYYEALNEIKALKETNLGLIKNNKFLAHSLDEKYNVIQYIYNEFKSLNLKSTEKLLNEINSFLVDNKLPEKVNFMKNVI